MQDKLFPLVVGTSRLMAGYFLLLGLLALIAIALTQLSAGTRLLIALGVMLLLGTSWLRFRRRQKLILRFKTEEDLWLLEEDGGEMVEAWLLSAQVYRFLVIMLFRLKNRKFRAVLVTSDSVNSEIHRRLRAYLMQGRGR